MNQAETIVADKIRKAFEGEGSVSSQYDFGKWTDISDSWLEQNEDIFLYYSHPDGRFLLPAFLLYLLRHDRGNPQSVIYINILGTLRELSKDKSENSFKNSITDLQYSALKAFIKHFRYNQSVNIDVVQWEKTLNDWAGKDV